MSETKEPAHPLCVCIRNDAGEVISPRRDCPVMVAFDRTGLT